MFRLLLLVRAKDGRHGDVAGTSNLPMKDVFPRPFALGMRLVKFVGEGNHVASQRAVASDGGGESVGHPCPSRRAVEGLENLGTRQARKVVSLG